MAQTIDLVLTLATVIDILSRLNVLLIDPLQTVHSVGNVAVKVRRTEGEGVHLLRHRLQQYIDIFHFIFIKIFSDLTVLFWFVVLQVSCAC